MFLIDYFFNFLICSNATGSIIPGNMLVTVED